MWENAITAQKNIAFTVITDLGDKQRGEETQHTHDIMYIRQFIQETNKLILHRSGVLSILDQKIALRVVLIEMIAHEYDF